jgi:hypothetical protein
MRRLAKRVLTIGPGEMITLRAKIPMMEMKMYWPSKPTISARTEKPYHSTDDAVRIQLFWQARMTFRVHLNALTLDRLFVVESVAEWSSMDMMAQPILRLLRCLAV